MRKLIIGSGLTAMALGTAAAAYAQKAGPAGAVNLSESPATARDNAYLKCAPESRQSKDHIKLKVEGKLQADARIKFAPDLKHSDLKYHAVPPAGCTKGN